MGWRPTGMPRGFCTCFMNADFELSAGEGVTFASPQRGLWGKLASSPPSAFLCLTISPSKK